MEGLKILVVDDEVRMRKLVKDFLSIKGFRVIEAGDGEEALEAFLRKRHCVNPVRRNDAENGRLAGGKNHPSIFKSPHYHADSPRRRTGRAAGV